MVPVEMNGRKSFRNCVGGEVAFECQYGEVSDSVSQRKTWWVAAEVSESHCSLSSGSVKYASVSWRSLWAAVREIVNRCQAVSGK